MLSSELAQQQHIALSAHIIGHLISGRRARQQHAVYIKERVMARTIPQLLRCLPFEIAGTVVADSPNRRPQSLFDTGDDYVQQILRLGDGNGIARHQQLRIGLKVDA